MIQDSLFISLNRFSY